MTLRVDDSEVHIHRDVLCKASPVFEAAFNAKGSFLEAETQKMDLDSSEVSINTLERFVQWLYADDYELSDPIGTTELGKQYMELTDLFVFAEKYFVVDLKNNIIKKLWDLRKVRRACLGSDAIRRIYDNTPKSSPFRRLLAAEYTWYASLNWYDEPDAHEVLCCNTDFAADVAIAMAKRLNGKLKNPFIGEASEFYETSSKATKSKKMDDAIDEGLDP